MKKIAFLFFIFSASILKSENTTQTSTPKSDATAQKNIEQKSSSKIKTTYVSFNYKDTPLAAIVNELATKKNINVIFPPQGPNALVTQITYSLDQKISLEDAWNMAITFLNLSGFTLIPHKELYYIIKNDPQNSSREAFPLYVNVPLDMIANSDTKIRYVLYINYLQVPAAQSGAEQNDPLVMMLRDILSPDGSYYFEPQLNALVLTERARIVKSAIELIKALDEQPLSPHCEVVQIKYTSADYIKSMLTSLIGAPIPDKNNPQQALAQAALLGSGGYFHKSTKIITNPKTNSLFLIGKPEAIQKTKQFIGDYLDKKQDTGDSVLHVYQLQYLNATEFAPILQSVLTPTKDDSASGAGDQGSGTGQSTSSFSSSSFRTFQGVIVKAEEDNSGQSNASGDSTEVQSSTIQSGNRLFIAATNNDYKEIKQFIANLDIPQQQVFIHTLVVDMTLDGARNLERQIRGGVLFDKTGGANSGGGINFQSAMMDSVETGVATSTSTSDLKWNSLNSNLLPATGSQLTATANINLANRADAGSFFISMRDNKTDGVSLISSALNKDHSTKILSEPLLITLNNKPVTFSFGQTKYLSGTATGDYGVAVVNQEAVPASYKFTFSPTISANGSVNLGIVIDIDSFTEGSDGSKTTRNVNTVANINDGEILVLGGLTRTSVNDNVYKLPLVGDIPFFGQFFKSKIRSTTKQSLMLFIRVEIIKPTAEKMNETTRKKYVEAISIYDNNEAFIGLRDPITRWFFGQSSMAPEEKQQFARFKGDFVPFPDELQPTYTNTQPKTPVQEPPALVQKTESTPNAQTTMPEKTSEETASLMTARTTAPQSLQQAKEKPLVIAATSSEKSVQDIKKLIDDAPHLEETLKKASNAVVC